MSPHTIAISKRCSRCRREDLLNDPKVGEGQEYYFWALGENNGLAANSPSGLYLRIGFVSQKRLKDE